MESARTIVNPVNGDKVTFLKTSAETGGEVTLCELEVFPYAQGNSEMPLHYHRSYTETFRVLEGELTVNTDKETMILKSGESATIPIRTPHSFSNESSAPVKAILEISPGNEGFEKSLCILYGLATDGKVNKNGLPKSITDMALSMTMGEVRLRGVFSVIFPIMKIFAKRGRKSGAEKALVDTYCKVLAQGT